MLQNTLEITAFTLWTVFVAYLTWYLTSAKHYAPITSNDAKMLWKIHKHDTQCEARRWRMVKRGGKIVGFKCECGHKHVQRRPVVMRPPVIRLSPQTTMFGRPGNLERSSKTRFGEQKSITKQS